MTKCTSKFASQFHIYDFGIFRSMCHSKSSNNNQSLLCFVRNQEYPLVKKWYHESS